MNVPGHVVECGVYKGSGIYTWAKLRAILKPNSHQKIVGFDFFETERKMDLKIRQDKEVLDAHLKNWSPRKIILNNLADAEINNVELIPGDVVKTTAEYAKKNLGFRIALLYLDVDNYEGTLAILKNFRAPRPALLPQIQRVFERKRHSFFPRILILISLP